MKKFKLGALIWCVCGPALAAISSENAGLHGFINQSLIKTSHNPYFGDTLSASGDFREIGINGFWEISDDLRIAGQILSRQAGRGDDGDPGIDFLMLDYQAYGDATREAGIRLGRIKTQYGFYNATRDVSQSRPGIFVPPSVYFESLRDVMISTDGVSLYGSHHTDIGRFALDIYAGERSFDGSALEQYVFACDVAGEFDMAKLKGLKLVFMPAGDQDFTLAFSLLAPEFELSNTANFHGQPPTGAMLADLAHPRQSLKYLTGLKVDGVSQLYSAQYGVGDWLLTAEYMRFNSRITDMSILHQEQPTLENTSEGGYVQVEWFAAPTLTVFARYEELYMDNDDRKGEQRLANGFSPVAHINYGRGGTLGLRWNMTPGFALSMEYAHNKGTAWLPVYEGRDAAALAEDWDLFALQLSYSF